MSRSIAGWHPVDPDIAGTEASAQIVDGQWYLPVWGCDSLQHLLDEPPALTAETVLKLLDQLAEWFDDPNRSRAVVIDVHGRLVTAGYLLRRIRDRLREVTS